MITVAPNISVRLHHREPANTDDRIERALENLLSLFADTGETWPLVMIRAHRSDLTDEALQDLIDDVFAANDELGTATDNGNPRMIQRAEDRYAETLHELASRPDDTPVRDDLCDLLKAVQPDSPVAVDELAARRGGA